MQLIPAYESARVRRIRELFVEYAASLGIDLCFQDFEAELAGLPGAYALPAGRLLLAVVDGRDAGCVALRSLEASICEMKRLYVRPEFRGRGFGRGLADTAIQEARSIGYGTMRLDTLAMMTPAIGLYRSLGFQTVAPYCYNPCSDAVYLELKLA